MFCKVGIDLGQEMSVPLCLVTCVMLGLSKGMGMVGMKKFMGKNQQECAIQTEPTEGNLGYSGLMGEKKEFKVYGKKSGGIKLRITGGAWVSQFSVCLWLRS